MSLHRADKHRAHQATDFPADANAAVEVARTASESGGHRRAARAPRRSTGFGPSSLLGGLALVVAAVGAATAGQAISTGHGTIPMSSGPTSGPRGAYVAAMSSPSLKGRDATRVSRSVTRPTLGKVNASTATSAERGARLRAAALRDAASDAQTYAQELSSNEWALPTSGFNISTWFGEAGPYWSSGFHTGIDFATAYGTPVVAVSNATVSQTGWDGPYGNQIRLRLENGDEVWYNHLSSIDVVAGQQIVKGQQIGRVGETGNAYGAHLHFEYRLASNLHDGVDPQPYLLEHGIVL
ncbi:MAG: M23 family metallopeptidase [Propionibacteriales bacterium]|nr:M23 family metallopeptidase [Propionibacteriales bacterium]